MTQTEIEARGCRVERVGQCWRISGPGVSILCADLRLIRDRDLAPIKVGEREQHGST